MAIETAGYQILIDPFFTGNPKAAITADQAKADFILISHGHGDHVGDSIAIASAPAPPSSATTRSASGSSSKASRKSTASSTAAGSTIPLAE